ncbi:MAG: aldehyde dehydrogenase [Planctomycetes bacterium]|nr:aldehyde dehydrogenase [Planctomycetota bacterium]
MKIQVGINGYGRIGRLVHRALLRRYPSAARVVAINGTADARTCAHLLRYDSTYGCLEEEVGCDTDGLLLRGCRIPVFRQSGPASIPWGEWDVDVVVEASGKWKTAAALDAHRSSGPKKVLATCPVEDADLTAVLGVNDALYEPARHHILSASSCTTNCLAPVCKVLCDRFGLEFGAATTIHAYTNDQRLLDGTHKDLRRARSAAQNIIPTTTGASKSLAEVLPNLRGRIHLTALRVPVPAVSTLLLSAELSMPASTEALLHAFQDAADGGLRGVLRMTTDPVVSGDLRGDPSSAVVDGDAGLTFAGPGCRAQVLAWYDNEWAYACRVADLVVRVIGRGLPAGAGPAARPAARPAATARATTTPVTP